MPCQVGISTQYGTEEQLFTPFDRLAVVGVGLMGGSLALAAKHKGLAKFVIAYSRNIETAKQAQQLGLVDEVAADFDTLLNQADAIFIATPVAQFAALFAQIAPRLKPLANGALPVLFDAGSTKGDVEQAVGEQAKPYPLFSRRFVLCHPIAGAERHGPSAASVHLYDKKTVVLCQSDRTDNDAFSQVSAFWRTLGAHLKILTPQVHDDMFAAVSHLPHLLAYVFVASLLKHPCGYDFMAEGGGGFRDFTRIAASSPEMWTDIFQANRFAIGNHLDEFIVLLEQMRAALHANDRSILLDVLTKASAFRSSWPNTEVAR
jgi:prephenate dehydrogenase